MCVRKNKTSNWLMIISCCCSWPCSHQVICFVVVVNRYFYFLRFPPLSLGVSTTIIQTTMDIESRLMIKKILFQNFFSMNSSIHSLRPFFTWLLMMMIVNMEKNYFYMTMLLLLLFSDKIEWKKMKWKMILHFRLFARTFCCSAGFLNCFFNECVST